MVRRLGWSIITALALLTVVIVSRYFTLDPDVFFPQQREVYLVHQTSVMLHITGGVLALALGPFQFLASIRRRRPRVHRWMGRIYLFGVLLGGSAGLYMSTFAYAGAIARLGFGALAVFWLATGFQAYRTIRRGDTQSHRMWMIRNFSLTFAAVTLRVYMPLLVMAFGDVTGYQLVAWLCWLPNLLVADAIARKQQRPREQALAS